MAALTVFASLFLTIWQFNQSQREQERRRFQQLEHELTSLLFEIEGNVSVCDHLLAEEANMKNAASVYFNAFHCDVIWHLVTESPLDDITLRQLKRKGDDNLTARQVSVTVVNTYHAMILLNDSLKRSADMLTFQALIKPDPEITERSNFRLREYADFAINDAKRIKSTLSDNRQLIETLRDRCAEAGQ